eukprot:5633411-Heterocapsa_arctica.AAC.1
METWVMSKIVQGNVLTPKWYNDGVDDLRHDVNTCISEYSGNTLADVNPIEGEVYQTLIRGYLQRAWAIAANDPGASVAKWTFEGAPAGIEADVDE